MTVTEMAVDCTAEQARDLTERIRTTVGVAWELVKQAYTSRAWAALGYGSWDAYCEAEFAGARLKLPRESRHEAVASLRDAGLSIRAIAAATGVGVASVKRDLDSGVPNGTPPDDASEVGPDVEPSPRPAAPRVTGTDGKSYPAAKPSAGPPTPSKPKRGPFMAEVPTAGLDLRRAVGRIERIAADDRFSSNREQVAAHWVDHLSHVVHVCQDVLDQLTEPPEDPA